MDWDSATDVNLELKLWESHSKVNNRFRKQLSSVIISIRYVPITHADDP